MRIKIFGHRRAGNHLLWNIIKHNFEVLTDKTKPSIRDDDCGDFKSHGQPGYPNKALSKRKCLYIVRDGRDCLIANYRYWIKGGEAGIRMKEAVKNAGLSNFIKGSYPAGVIENIPTKFKLSIKHFKDPIGFWLENTKWTDTLYTIKFEDLIYNQKDIILSLAQELNLSLKNGKPEIFEKPVGPFARKSAPGSWREKLSVADKKYFWERAGKRMLELGYPED
jgi:hypothetical protein